jgi:predicted ATPase
MRQLPTGTVTFLFSDIEGSTRLLHELGTERYAEVLAEHRALMRRAFTAHGGVEVDTQGDAFFVAFGSADAAAAAAIDAQQSLVAGPIHVRMGMHTGTASFSDGSYVGRDVHLGARICAAGHGGQVLLSRQARDLIDGDVLDLGEHRLKDFATAVWIYQLGHERFPPLRTISNTNLPRPASALVGRGREIAEVSDALRDGARLLTLTGPGGTGKTRLAIAAATELVPFNRNGVFWVPLAAMTDPALVISEVAQTLGAKSELAEHVGEREMLILLDNFEQVVDAASELSALLSACPNLRALVTSRERLRVQGEVEYAVPPLAEPDAVELFCTRAGVDTDATIAELCRRLDNLPLAVELAAARASVLSPSQILGRLAQRLDLLKGGRGADARQQTLRATIEWSHDLLNADEQALFARLAVFAGGFTLEAAEQIVDADLDTLQSLVDKSLVRHVEARFIMLETIREFAAERLAESSDANEYRRRHADFFVALATEAESSLEKNQKEWLSRLEAEKDDIRAALDQLEALGEIQRAMQFAGALAVYWDMDHVAEGKHRLERLLAIDERPTSSRAKALATAGLLARQSGDHKTASRRAGEALALYRDLGDAQGNAGVTVTLGLALADEGDFAGARELFETSVQLFHDLGDEVNALFASRLLAWMYDELGDRVKAWALYEQNLGWARTLGNRPMEAQALGAVASMALDQGRADDAVSLLKDVLRIDRDMGANFQTAIDLTRFARALAFAGGRDTEAASLLAIAEVLRVEMGAGGMPYLLRNHDEALAILRTRLDEAALADALRQGANLRADEAIALALGEVRTSA